VNKGHGRIEQREVWLVDARDLEGYLLKEFGWKQGRLVGKIRRSRRLTKDTQWRTQESTTWICSLAPEETTPEKIELALRHHWTIENGIFYVRDESYGEDRNHARRIGLPISEIRNLAITLIRCAGYAFMTDAWADISSRPDLGFSNLIQL
jgi:predicted transposase YbfD/YdcC